MDSKKTIVVIPQMLITDELVELASNAIDSFRKHDVYIISVDDAGEFPKAKGASRSSMAPVPADFFPMTGSKK